MDLIREKSTPTLSIVFYDKNGEPVAPLTFSYKIHDQSGTEVRATTNINPGGSIIELMLAVADTTILDTNNTEEIRTLTYSWTYGGNEYDNDEYKYKIKNLAYIS